MKKLFYLSLITTLCSCVESPGSYSKVIRTGDYAVEVTAIVIAAIFFVYFFVASSKLGGIKKQISILSKEKSKTNDKSYIIEYFANKELYGKDVAIDKFKQYILLHYSTNVDLKYNISSKKIEDLRAELIAKYSIILDDAGIELPKLPSLCDSTKLLIPGSFCRVKNNLNICKVIDFNIEKNEVKVRYAWNHEETLSVDEVAIVLE